MSGVTTSDTSSLLANAVETKVSGAYDAERFPILPSQFRRPYVLPSIQNPLHSPAPAEAHEESIGPPDSTDKAWQSRWAAFRHS